MVALLTSSILFTACRKDDDADTNQMQTGKIALNVYGPVPAMRGGELRFIGTNLNKVTQIDLPGAEGIKDITQTNKNEIRILIPQTAEPGFITLHTPDGEIVTKTEITFTEPISLDKVTPAEAKAGQTITIEGDYLNNVEEVILAEDVHILKDDFVSQSRKKIEIKVPVNAQTGQVIVSDGLDLLSDGEEIPNWIYSEEELVITIPEVTKLSPNPVKAGEELTIEGTLLRLVEFVIFENSEPTLVAQKDPTKDIETLVVEVPVDAISGDLTLVLLSGVEVNAGEITLVEPTAEIDNAKDEYGVGEELVISGENLDLVKQINFENNDEAEFSLTEEGKIVIEVPADAQSGNISLILGNGNAVSVEGFVTAKPVFTFPATATPLDKLEIESTLGDRVASFLFGELEAEATATDNGFEVVVPLEAESGSVVMVMTNGEEVEVGEITISAIDFAVLVGVNAEVTVEAGSLFESTIFNANQLVEVRVNGEEVKYVTIEDKIYLSAGYSVGLATITLISSNGIEADFEITVYSADVLEAPIWDKGPLEITWNDGGRVVLKASDFENVPAGSILRFYFMDIDGAWGQAQINNGDWKELYPTLVPSDIEEYNWWDIKDTERVYDIELTAGLLNDINENQATEGDFEGAGIIIQGSDLIFSKVTLIIDYSGPETIWEDVFENFGWAGNQDLAWGGFDWSTVKAGQTLYFTFSVKDGEDWGCISLRHGEGWGNLPGDVASQIDFGAGDNSWSLELTQEIIDDLNANSGLVITGENLTITKIGLK